MHFRTPISFLYFSSPLWTFFISPTVAHIRNDRIYLPSFSRAAPVRVDSWNLHDVVSHPETLCVSSFFYNLSIRVCVSFSSVTLIPPLIESFLSRPIYRWYNPVKSKKKYIYIYEG